MLQPMPARPFFRVLEAPLGILMIGAGLLIAVVGVQLLVSNDWLWGIGFVLFGPVFVVFGGLGIIHAFTGGLPEWLVGDGRDEDATSAA